LFPVERLTVAEANEIAIEEADATLTPSAKSERDCSAGSFKVRAKVAGVSWKWQSLGWSFVMLPKGSLLFYVYLFALRQTHSRQSAWFQSFVMWLVFEVTVSSTGLVWYGGCC
jgi:hypothetical protein